MVRFFSTTKRSRTEDFYEHTSHSKWQTPYHVTAYSNTGKHCDDNEVKTTVSLANMPTLLKYRYKSRETDQVLASVIYVTITITEIANNEKNNQFVNYNEND